MGTTFLVKELKNNFLFTLEMPKTMFYLNVKFLEKMCKVKTYKDSI